MNWISVLESKPKEREECLVWHDDTLYYEIATYDGNGKWTNDEFERIFPSHWTLLPEPPKEK